MVFEPVEHMALDVVLMKTFTQSFGLLCIQFSPAGRSLKTLPSSALMNQGYVQYQGWCDSVTRYQSDSFNILLGICQYQY